MPTIPGPGVKQIMPTLKEVQSTSFNPGTTTSNVLPAPTPAPVPYNPNAVQNTLPDPTQGAGLPQNTQTVPVPEVTPPVTPGVDTANGSWFAMPSGIGSFTNGEAVLIGGGAAVLVGVIIYALW